MPHRPTMIFDGECRFCRRWIARWRRRTESRVRYIPFQCLGTRFPEVSRDACKDAVQFVDTTGKISSGADAVVQLFRFGLPGGRFSAFALSLPPLIWFLRAGYGIVARNRSLLSKLLIPSRKRSGRGA